MKALLIGECRGGQVLDSTWELFGYAAKAGVEPVLFMVGTREAVAGAGARVLMADTSKHGEYNPDAHKLLILEAIRRENPDQVVFMHSSFGWDLAPRVAAALGVAQISEVIGIAEGGFELGACNAKMRRTVVPTMAKPVITLQGGAFQGQKPAGSPDIQDLDVEASSRMEFLGYEEPEKKDVDLATAEVIVSAGRGVGKKDNISVIEALARALGGELGASRPVVDAGWVTQSHQVGTTGQTVAPKLYVACGISGAIQHLAGMKKSEFILAINKDRDAPIGEVADVLVVADLLQFVPALTAKLGR
ncbi:MAG: electron transfer flavoprotein subunit alpha/FixB family protein [Rectinemataceae bacterium]